MPSSTRSSATRLNDSRMVFAGAGPGWNGAPGP